jgi:3D (Asp-Asp-Asp) domain-containing protein
VLLLSRSLRRKLLATALSVGVFTLLYQATVIDSRSVSSPGLSAVGPPAMNTRAAFQATAYCKGQTTASGVAVRAGIAAADPKVLPIGSVIRVDGAGERYEGIYTVLDTGPAIQGRIIDLYMWSCYEALEFGRKDISVTVLRRGWAQSQVRK